MKFLLLFLVWSITYGVSFGIVEIISSGNSEDAIKSAILVLISTVVMCTVWIVSTIKECSIKKQG